MAEAALEGRPDGAHEEGPEEGIAEQATQDDFLDGITQTEGPLALYKQNRLSGRYRRVHPPTQWLNTHMVEFAPSYTSPVPAHQHILP